MQLKLIEGDAGRFSCSADLIFTDPPYEMGGSELARILERYDSSHLVLITTMRQLVDFLAVTDWHLAFDFVLDGVAPKKSKANHQPNYLHQTGVYLTKPGEKSRFSRKLRQRSDVFVDNGYWPTIIRAPRDNSRHGMGKNVDSITDILGSFDAESVIDPFAGGGSVGLAAFELDMDCTLIEMEHKNILSIQQLFKFMGGRMDYVCLNS